MINIEYKIKTLRKDDILNYLLCCNKDFIPVLDLNTDLNEFSDKIFENTITFEAWNKQTLIGLTSAYFNDFENQTGFINHVSVLKEYRRKHISKSLLTQCINYAIKKGFESIKLEVTKDNMAAIDLYNKLGFFSEKNINKKILMKKQLLEKRNEKGL
ncbi:MAG: hypothetical protein DRG78_13450 [Epsilonproteobacteria bacterium]|nr:MAG: hypothetical protein DRG78_13450 [Campylobacterota bacterium]